jgi:lincosamide nucleotidyltransferase B/F
MNKVTLLLQRLDEIGQSLANTGHGLALLGLGSVGTERERLDEYSDLDFFAIVEQGYKQQFINDTTWLAVKPIVYLFRNTEDGFKYLYEDGVFCEMAIFEPQELATIPFVSPKIVWQSPTFDESIAQPQILPQLSNHSVDWCIGEILTNLLVGVTRYHRGEKLIAQRFIQHYAVDRVLNILPQVESEKAFYPDPYNRERRFEVRFPQTALLIPTFVQGYDHSLESALAILTFLEQHFSINTAMSTEIKRLARS